MFTGTVIIPWGFPGGSVAKTLPAAQETWVQSLGQEDPLEKEAWESHAQRNLAGCSLGVERV